MRFTANIALKVAIVSSLKKQNEIARAANIDVTTLSHIVRGRRIATKDEREALALALGKSISDLFPPNEEAVAS